MVSDFYWFAVMMTICISFIMCCSSYSTPKPVVLERTLHDTVHVNNLRLDSIYMHDSIYFESIIKGDTVYRTKEITSDAVPLPKPSNAPHAVTDTQDTTKPILMQCSACSPMAIVAALAVNSPIILPAKHWHATVPAAIMAALSPSVISKIFLTRLLSPAP